MKSTDHHRVETFMQDLQSVSPEQYAMVESIRNIFHSADDRLVEDIKYGGLVFNFSGELIAGIFAYKQHISIEFSNGVAFADPTGLLEGQGKSRRHLKIVNQQDIEGKKVARFIAMSVPS